MSYEDPRGHDPQFPDRPTHQDFIDLSDVVQGNDLRSEAMVGPMEILGLDQEAVSYFLQERLNLFDRLTNGAIMQVPWQLLMAMYLDAMAAGKGLAELRARRGEIPS